MSENNSSHNGIYAYDTIRCGIGIENDFIICNNIMVNGILLWERNNNYEEPFFELEKEYCEQGTVGL